MRPGSRAVSTAVSAILVAVALIGVVAATYVAVQRQVEQQRSLTAVENVKRVLAELGSGAAEARTVSVRLPAPLTVEAAPVGTVTVTSFTPAGPQERRLSYSVLRCRIPEGLYGSGTVPVVGELEEPVASGSALTLYTDGSWMNAAVKPSVAVAGLKIEVRVSTFKPGVASGESLKVSEAARSRTTLTTPILGRAWTWRVNVETPWGVKGFNVEVPAGSSGLLVIEYIEYEVK